MAGDPDVVEMVRNLARLNEPKGWRLWVRAVKNEITDFGVRVTAEVISKFIRPP